MKRPFTEFLIAVIFISFIFPAARITNAQWQPDLRLTNNSAGSYTGSNNAWSIAANGDVVHVVWYDLRDTNSEIYYKRSPDGGVSWSADTRLTNNTSISMNPSVAVLGSNVYVVWQDGRNGGTEIYFKQSTDAGISWGADTRLSNNSQPSTSPSLAVTASALYVVWCDGRNGNNGEIYYKCSTNGGLNWTSDLRLTNDSAVTNYPSISISGSVVHVVWYDERDGNSEIYYKRSTVGDSTWGADVRLSNNSASSLFPCVSVSGSVVHVVWYDDRDGNSEIYYKRSPDAGLSWGVEKRLTQNAGSSYNPSVAASGSDVNISWVDISDGNKEIYFKHSSDGGLNWGADKRLTNDPFDSYYNSLSALGSVVNVAWVDTRDGNPEMYFKHNPNVNFPPPSAPFNLTALAVSTTMIKLNWTDTSSIEEGFKIERSTDAGSSWVQIDSLGQNAVSYFDTALAPSTIYHYRIYAFNSIGNSAYSNIAFDTTFVLAPLAPTLLLPLDSATGQSLTPTLDWTTVAGALTYGVQASIHENFDTLAVNVTGLDSSHYTIPINVLMNHTWYYWRANATNSTGTGPWSIVWSFETMYLGLNTYSNEIPKVYKLYNNFPNPFNPATKIRFDIPKTSKVKIVVYDLLGRETELLFDNILNPGKFEITWNASNYSSGVYFYRLTTDNYTETKKMILVK